VFNREKLVPNMYVQVRACLKSFNFYKEDALHLHRLLQSVNKIKRPYVYRRGMGIFEKSKCPQSLKYKSQCPNKIIMQQQNEWHFYAY